MGNVVGVAGDGWPVGGMCDGVLVPVSKLVMVGATTRLLVGVLGFDVPAREITLPGLGAGEGDFSKDVNSGEVPCLC